MLSVVADDHDMGITHIIRGDDHLTNTFKQMQIYEACGWTIPKFAHIPLIYGIDGAKLSKRHGAVSAEEYRSMGVLPEAIMNYLLRLGWSHSNDEIISIPDAIKWFDICDVRKSPSRFDIAKLQNLSSHYIKNKDNSLLYEDLKPFLVSEYQYITEEQECYIKKGLNSLKERANTLVEIAKSCDFLIKAPCDFDLCSKFATPKHIATLSKFAEQIVGMEQFSEQALLDEAKRIVSERGEKLLDLAQALRASLTGRLVSPSVFEIMSIIGKEKTLSRINFFIESFSTT
jgi:glutamyl-tRNA synthetase